MAAKIIKVIFLSLFVSLSAYSNTGYGNLKLSANVVVTFQKYLDFNSVHNKSKGPDAWGRPGMFAISKDGLVAGYGYCPRGKQCRPSPSVALNSCRNRGGDNCQIFAKGRKIVWNKVNHRISRKATRSEIVKILEDLSFYGDNESKIKPFISKKKKKSKNDDNSHYRKESDNIVSLLKSLKDLYDSGDLSKEQYEKAKKKLLD